MRFYYWLKHWEFYIEKSNIGMWHYSKSFDNCCDFFIEIAVFGVFIGIGVPRFKCKGSN